MCIWGGKMRPAPMNTYDRTKAREWLREMRGDMSQAALAEDITASTGWTITRDRYSKYESGNPSSPMGREVFARFVSYWTGKGRPAPDMTPPAPLLSLEERAVRAAERQAAALEAIAFHLLGTTAAEGTEPDPRALAAIAAFHASAGSASQPQPSDLPR